jgi:hypothetical protein
MAQVEKHGLAQVVRAVDERWWLRHGLFWLVRTGLMALLFLYDLRTTTDWRMALRDALILLVPQLLATYSLLYGVLPLLWHNDRRGRFLLLLVVWFGGSLALTFAHRFYVFVPSHQHEPSAFPDYNIVFATGAHMPLLLVAGVAACLHVYRRWRQKELANAQLQQENVQAELQLLKAQIHPHFLFNTLNNLYALTLRQSDEAPAVVERLSSLLFFMVEQGAAAVALPDEVALLRDYIALEQLRYGSRLTLDFYAEDIPPTVRIAPLLLLPLVENAFKHGSAEQLGQAHICVLLAVENNVFSCVITNTKSPDVTSGAGSEGIGLHNVRQRLHLLYPQRHRFEIEAGADTFTVRLTLHLPDAAATDHVKQRAQHELVILEDDGSSAGQQAEVAASPAPLVTAQPV